MPRGGSAFSFCGRTTRLVGAGARLLRSLNRTQSGPRTCLHLGQVGFPVQARIHIQVSVWDVAGCQLEVRLWKGGPGKWEKASTLPGPDCSEKKTIDLRDETNPVSTTPTPTQGAWPGYSFFQICFPVS